MANYYISGVVFETENNSREISHLSLHTCSSEIAVSKGVLIPKADVIKMIKEQHLVKTMRWDYENAVWEEGAKIIIDTQNGEEKLKCLKNATVIDCLEHLIDLNTLKY